MLFIINYSIAKLHLPPVAGALYNVYSNLGKREHAARYSALSHSRGVEGTRNVYYVGFRVVFAKFMLDLVLDPM